MPSISSDCWGNAPLLALVHSAEDLNHARRSGDFLIAVVGLAFLQKHQMFGHFQSRKTAIRKSPLRVGMDPSVGRRGQSTVPCFPSTTPLDSYSPEFIFEDIKSLM